MSLRTDAINGNTLGDPVLDVLDQALRLSVRGGVKAGDISILYQQKRMESSLIVIDVQLRIRVSRPSRLKRDLHKVLAQYIVEDAGTEAATF